jgi:Zn-finger nucleic acid-binding protein
MPSLDDPVVTKCPVCIVEMRKVETLFRTYRCPDCRSLWYWDLGLHGWSRVDH